MSQCINGYDLKDMRLLDVIKGRSFSTLDTPLKGDEELVFLSRYEQVLDQWRSRAASSDNDGSSQK